MKAHFGISSNNTRPKQETKPKLFHLESNPDLHHHLLKAKLRKVKLKKTYTVPCELK